MRIFIAVAIASSCLMAAAPVDMVVTARSGSLEPGDIAVQQGKSVVRVTGLERLNGDLADMQLFVLLDDSTRSSSLGTHLQELKTFLGSLPGATQVAIGYMRNGTFGLTQAFTADHQKAIAGLRLPESLPGANGSPYFAISELVNHWPSKEPTHRRAVLVLTDGIDRYYGSPDLDDPYVDAAVHDALKQGVMLYTIYLRGAGYYGNSAFITNLAQSHLMEIAQDTGGFAYFETFSDPVAIAPFLSDLETRFENQYRVRFEPVSGKGVEHVKVRTETPGLKVEAPSEIYVR
jgi:hypothetical protein